MAITKNSSRQYPLVAKVEFAYDDLTSGVAEEAIDLPGGARVVGGRIAITTAFDSVTSDTLTVGDGTTADRYASGVDGQAVGSTELTPDEAANTVGKGAVGLTWTESGGGVSQGAGFLEVEYVIDGRANEAQPV